MNWRPQQYIAVETIEICRMLHFIVQEGSLVIQTFMQHALVVQAVAALQCNFTCPCYCANIKSVLGTGE